MTFTDDIKVERQHWSGFILDEMPLSYCRAEITIAPLQDIVAGTVLGKRTAGTTTVDAATFEGDGDGTLTLADPAYGAGVMEGDYTITCTTESAGGGGFTLKAPNGAEDDTIVVGTPYDGVIKFTIAAGSADFVEDDVFTVHVNHVTGADGEYLPYDPNATDGAETVAGVAIYSANTLGGVTKNIAALVRGPSTVTINQLIWFEGATEVEIAAGVAALMAIGIRAL